MVILLIPRMIINPNPFNASSFESLLNSSLIAGRPASDAAVSTLQAAGYTLENLIKD